MRASSVIALFTIVVAAACANPVHTDAVEAQGGDSSGEFNGISPGPTHRSGQQCMVCHGGDGPGSPQFAFAGTVFAFRGGTTPMQGVTVRITDAKGETHEVVSNEAGNFYIEKANWNAEMPSHVALSYKDGSGKTFAQTMTSRIGVNGGCATCHYGADGQAQHMPPVYLKDAP